MKSRSLFTFVRDQIWSRNKSVAVVARGPSPFNL